MTRSGSAASVISRVLASLVDTLVVAGPAVGVWMALPSPVNVAGALLVALALEALQILVLRARFTWTVGGGLFGIRVVDVATGGPIGIARSALRTGVIVAGLAVGGVGALVVLASPLFTDRRLGWHDEAADCEVLYRPKAPEPAPSASALGIRPAQGVVGPPATGLVPVLAYGLKPEIELTRRADPRDDIWDGEDTYQPMTATMALSDSTVHVLSGVVLVGRNPIAEPGQRALRLGDPARSVSRTHLRLTIGPIAVWAEDLASTNGSVIHLPDGNTETCPPGRPVQIPVGTVVRLGDSWIRVTAVAGEPTFPDRTMKR